MPTLDHNTCFMQSILINLCVTVSCSPFSFISVLLFLAVHSHSSLCSHLFLCCRFFHSIFICLCVAVSFTPFSFVFVLLLFSLYFHSSLCCLFFHSILIHLHVACCFFHSILIHLSVAISCNPVSFISVLLVW